MQVVFHFSNTRRVLLNTLRRTILRDLPTLAFPRSSVRMEKLTSKILDDEIVALRISTIPIPPLQHGLFMACDVSNTTEDKIHVTTSDCTYWSGLEKAVTVANPFTRPIRICPLSTGETIRFSALASLATPASFSSNESESGFLHTPCSKCFFDEDGKFTLYPRRGYKATNILLDALEVIRVRVESCEAGIPAKGLTTGEIVFRDDRYTMPMLLSEYLRDEKEVEFVAAHCEHLLEAEGQVTVKLQDNAGKLGDILGSAKMAILKDLGSLHRQVAAASALA